MRKILAVILGMIAGTLVFFVFGAIASTIQPKPADLDFNDPQAVTEAIEAIPAVVWLVHILGAAVGGFVGGVVGAAIAKEKVFLSLRDGSVACLAGKPGEPAKQESAKRE